MWVSSFFLFLGVSTTLVPHDRSNVAGREATCNIAPSSPLYDPMLQVASRPATLLWPKMLCGVALGDALGFGVESQTPATLASIDFSHGYVFMRTGAFAVNCGPGYVSDDTMETTVIHRVLMDHNCVLPNASVVLQALLDMYDSEKARSGGVPRQGFGALKDVGETPLADRPAAIAALYAKQVDPETGAYRKHLRGNAPVMRVLPITLCPFDFEHQESDSITVNADATHPHPITRVCSILMAKTMRYAGHPTKISGRLIWWMNLRIYELSGEEGNSETLYFYRQVREYLYSIKDLPNTLDNHTRLILTGNTDKGCPVDSMHTLGVVVWLLQHYDGTWNYVLEALRIGGDTDTYMAPFVGILMASDLLKRHQVPDWAFDGLEQGHRFC